ncbi:hypothetical protein R3L01_04215, partial [Streptococcus pyogenes]
KETANPFLIKGLERLLIKNTPVNVFFQAFSYNITEKVTFFQVGNMFTKVIKGCFILIYQILNDCDNM